MGHHLVVFVANGISVKNRDSTASLLAFNLEDHRIQRVELESHYLKSKDDSSSFLKYGENQIIKYIPFCYEYSSYLNMVCITVESFERIL